MFKRDQDTDMAVNLYVSINFKAAKRRYGYFALPILIGDKFVARMDAKADRKRKSSTDS